MRRALASVHLPEYNVLTEISARLYVLVSTFFPKFIPFPKLIGFLCPAKLPVFTDFAGNRIILTNSLNVWHLSS